MSDGVDEGRMPHPDAFRVRELLGPHAVVCHRAVTGEHGIALPPLHDHHVHVHLTDPAELPRGGIAAAVDLGGDPVALVRRRRGSMPRIAYAGAFLTAAGGYPSDRSWAPPATVREVTCHGVVGRDGAAETAIDEQAAFGASVVKVALNAAAGPVLERDCLDAIVAAARAHGLPVVAHVEGPGMTRLALDAGVDVLAHTPFTETLDDDDLARAATGQTWISTLSLHGSADAARALANAAAFVAAGGRLLYGTDLGNGDLPIGVNPRELRALDAAGLRGPALVAALADPWPLGEAPHGVATFVAGPPPAGWDGIPDWLGRATVVPAEELVHEGP